MRELVMEYLEIEEPGNGGAGSRESWAIGKWEIRIED